MEELGKLIEEYQKLGLKIQEIRDMHNPKHTCFYHRSSMGDRNRLIDEINNAKRKAACKRCIFDKTKSNN